MGDHVQPLAPLARDGDFGLGARRVQGRVGRGEESASVAGWVVPDVAVCAVEG